MSWIFEQWVAGRAGVDRFVVAVAAHAPPVLAGPPILQTWTLSFVDEQVNPFWQEEKPV